MKKSCEFYKEKNEIINKTVVRIKKKKCKNLLHFQRKI